VKVMSTSNIWYGVLEAGEKSSPVVRDFSMEGNAKRVYLYNYARNQFIEYSLAIVEPKLRELAEGDVSREELEKAFNTAYQAFTSSRKVSSWSDTKRDTSNVKNEDDDDLDFDMSDDDDLEEFIDDD
jgi:hypothetical protein